MPLARLDDEDYPRDDGQPRSCCWCNRPSCAALTRPGDHTEALGLRPPPVLPRQLALAIRIRALFDDVLTLDSATASSCSCRTTGPGAGRITSWEARLGGAPSTRSARPTRTAHPLTSMASHVHAT